MIHLNSPPQQLVKGDLNIVCKGNEVELMLVNGGQARLGSGRQIVYAELNLCVVLYGVTTGY